MAVLSAEQCAQYQRGGYVLVSGLVPPDLAAAGQAAMERVAAGTKYGGTNDPDIVRCYTPALLAAAAELGGGDPASYRAPTSALAIIAQPTAEPWHWPTPHIDHAIKDHGHRVFPHEFRVASMLFLSVAPSHGGGTVVWPGSHTTLEDTARKSPEQYELMWTLNQELKSLDLGEPVELTPLCGDILFYQYLCAHAGSMNTSDRPRLALNYKW